MFIKEDYGTAEIPSVVLTKEIVETTKAAGASSGISITTSKKASGFILYSRSPTKYMLVPNDEGTQLSTYDTGSTPVGTTNVTITYNDNSIEISPFSWSSNAYYFLAVVYYT